MRAMNSLNRGGLDETLPIKQQGIYFAKQI